MKRCVEQAMKRSGGNQTRAAELMGISRDQLRYRLKKRVQHMLHQKTGAFHDKIQVDDPWRQNRDTERFAEQF